MELAPTIAGCFSSRNADEIVRQLEAFLATSIADVDTVLFIDEIQESNDALVALRAFKEQRPHLDMVAAGSLLEDQIQSLEFLIASDI